MDEQTASPYRQELVDALSGVEDPLEKRLLFVAILSKAFQNLGLGPPVLVGGQAVELYTAGGYATQDIDLVVSSEPLSDVLGRWGFEKEGRHWFDDELGLVVEAPSAQLDPEEQERVTMVEVGGYAAAVVGIEDLIIDRLNMCAHWKDKEACGWARVLLSVHREKLDWTYLEHRADEEDVATELHQARAEVRDE